MYNHAPADYICPICLAIQGLENSDTLIKQADIVYQDDRVMVFVASFFIGQNPGHLIVVPIQHSENIYDLPAESGTQIFAAAKKFAILMKKAYECDGVMVLQNNEPASGQHAFHYHLHLFPRYESDQIFDSMTNKRLTTPAERQPFVQKLKNQLANS